MNKLDLDYQALLSDIMDNGVEKKGRNGETISVFGRQIRHKMEDGFPLLTTKKMAWKVIVTELLWFLRGDTNIKYLVDNGCNIWNGDAYKKYEIEFDKGNATGTTNLGKRIGVDNEEIKLSKEDFIDMIKNSEEYGCEDFANKWGELGPIYGKQWRHSGGYVKTPMVGWIKKGDDGIWLMHWSDTSGGHDDCCHTPIKDYDHLTDEDIDKRVEFEFEADYETFQPHKYAIIIKEPKDVWVNHVDQIANVIDQLRNNPDSRRMMVNAWNVGEIDSMTLPPCHYGFQVYTRELSVDERNKWFQINRNGNNPLMKSDWKDYELDQQNIPKRAISLMWNQRSVDTFLGLPFNIASYGLLLEILAKEVNMIPDELIGNLGDTHLYSNHIEQAYEQIGSEISDKQLTRLLKKMDAESFELLVRSKELKKIAVSSQDFEAASEHKDNERKAKEKLAKLELDLRDRQPFILPTITLAGEVKWVEGDVLPYYSPEHIILNDYESHPPIKAPLSN